MSTLFTDYQLSSGTEGVEVDVEEEYGVEEEDLLVAQILVY